MSLVYIRSESDNGVRAQLVLGKNRVAPVKEISIPRLELLSNYIVVRLAEMLREAISVKLDTIFWTDSTTLLPWIRRNEPWNTFMGNRISEIRKSNIENSRHASGHLNPADLPSRGHSFNISEVELGKTLNG